MFSALSRVKDAALERGLTMALGPRLERYGQLRDLKIDTVARLIKAEVLLLGETEPVQISQARYRVEEDGNDKCAIFYDIVISKPWAQNILKDHFPEIRVKLPEFAKNFIS